MLIPFSAICRAVSATMVAMVCVMSTSLKSFISGASSILFSVDMSWSNAVSRWLCAKHLCMNSCLVSSVMSGFPSMVSRYPCMLATGVFSSWAMFCVSWRFSTSCSLRVLSNRLYILIILSAISPSSSAGKATRSSVSIDSLWSALVAKARRLLMLRDRRPVKRHSTMVSTSMMPRANQM